MKIIKFIFSLLILTIISMPVNAQVFELSSVKNSSFKINQNFPVVYKPSKLVIGTKTKFTIKAEPHSHVSLVTSEESAGYPEFFGHKLRLGQTINHYEDIAGESGVIEIELPLPEVKALVGRILYFEVLVWKKPDFSDLQVAKIMGIDAKETDCNAVMIAEPPKKSSLPGFGPAIPGTGGDLNKTMEILNKINDTDSDVNYDEQMYYNNEPLMIRNLRAPDLKKE